MFPLANLLGMKLDYMKVYSHLVFWFNILLDSFLKKHLILNIKLSCISGLINELMFLHKLKWFSIVIMHE